MIKQLLMIMIIIINEILNVKIYLIIIQKNYVFKFIYLFAILKRKRKG